jgi:hypothetical protein
LPLFTSASGRSQRVMDEEDEKIMSKDKKRVKKDLHRKK